MAAHSSVLAWRIPGTAEPGGLLSVGSHRVGHNWSDFAAAAAAWIWDEHQLSLPWRFHTKTRLSNFSWKIRCSNWSSSTAHFSQRNWFPVCLVHRLTPHFWGLIVSELEKAMAPHSSTLAWKIPWMEEPGRLQSMGSLESDTTERLHFDFSLSCIGEGNGNPLQCSCLENPRDGGAWWAAVYGVTQSQTRLKQLRSSSSSSSKETVYQMGNQTGNQEGQQASVRCLTLLIKLKITVRFQFML